MEMEMIAEGYYATESIHKLNDEYHIHMPILEFVYQVIYGSNDVKGEAKKLTYLLN
jgi:glycerol-3-phosphate dehydrogenase (NAD(P)+)